MVKYKRKRGGFIEIRITKKKRQEDIGFSIITKVTIVTMIIYIFVKLFSLIFVGSTRELLIIETKQWMGKTIKNFICNEIIKGDKYLTEDKVISTVSMQERNKEISDIDKNIGIVKKALEVYEGKLVEEVKAFAKKEKKIIVKRRLKKGSLENVENILYAYEPKYKNVISNVKIINNIKNTRNNKYMLEKLYSVDGSTSIDKNVFNVSKLIKISNMIKRDNEKAKILIYHTHASEGYIDSKKRESDTVVGVGDYLEELLEKKYGYKVLHVKKKFDIVNNKWNRNAYDTALPYIKEILRKNPSIEVVIDLHRDSGKEKVVTKISDVTVAKLMYFNGVCRSKIGNRREIPNNNLKYNLAFSMDMQMESMMMYPGLTKKIYLKGYRYNMHLAKKAMLVEVGNNKNTVLEAKYAMIPFSKILNKVLTTP